jgi:hypothetical protein
MLSVAYASAVAGDRTRAHEVLGLYELPVVPFHMYTRARIHAVLGEKNEALAWLGRAADAGLRRPKRAAPHPDFDPLRDDPRFAAWRARVER